MACITALALSLGVHPELLLCVVTRNTCTGIDVPSLIDTTLHACSPGICCHLLRAGFAFAVDQDVCIPLEHQHVSTFARHCSCCTRRHVLCIRHRIPRTLPVDNHRNMRKIHCLATPAIARLVLIYWTGNATTIWGAVGTSALFAGGALVSRGTVCAEHADFLGLQAVVRICHAFSNLILVLRAFRTFAPCCIGRVCNTLCHRTCAAGKVAQCGVYDKAPRT